YTIAEFCQMLTISKSKYYRLRSAGQGPREVLFLGRDRRIVAEEVHVWLAANIEPVTIDPEPGGDMSDAATQYRRKHHRLVVPNRTDSHSYRRETMFDPPPPKPKRLPHTQ